VVYVRTYEAIQLTLAGIALVIAIVKLGRSKD